MTREEAKALLPIIQAYTEGKTIQTKIKTDSTGLAEEWIDVINPDLDGSPGCYRIKPEPTYRSFKDADECWQEMRKHQPFGWVIGKDGVYMQIDKISKSFFHVSGTTLAIDYTLNEGFELLKFADSTPFGILE